MVAQSRLRNPSATRRPWLTLVLPSLTVLLLALLISSTQVQASALKRGEYANVPHVKAWSSAEADTMVDQSQRLFDEQFWGSNSASELVSSIPSLNWIRKHLGTKSPYPHEDKHAGPLSDTPQGYELAQLHLICRHGTRYPSSSNAITFARLTEKLKQTTQPGFEWLRRWPSEKMYPVAKGNLLAAKGDSDLYRIGQRFGIRYKEFLDRYPYDANTYEIQSSAKSRCSQSAYGFSVGLLEGRHVTDPGKGEGQRSISVRPPVQPVDIFTTPIGLDKELAVKYACPRWLESVKEDPNVRRQERTYQERFLPELAEQISSMFSLGDGSRSVNITTKDVETIFGICGFEVAFYNNDQTWCQLLRKGTMRPVRSAFATNKEAEGEFDGDRAHFLTLEISNDLDDYYTHGPGVPFNRHLGCKLGTSLSNAIELALSPENEGLSSTKKRDDDEEGWDRFRGLFKFGHSETIFFFSSFLGLYDQKGVPLRGDMTPEEYAQREFRSSRISPFAANIAFEVYRPKPADNMRRKRRLESYHDDGDMVEPETDPTPTPAPKGLVRLLVNEEPMIIPGCGSHYFCEWATLKEVLQQAGAGCDFEGCCTSLGGDDGPAESDIFKQIPQMCLAVEPVV